MNYYSNIDLLNGIRRSDTIVLQFIYKNFYSNINFFIKSNYGNEEDANDIFQEGIIVIFRKLKEKDLSLDCSFNTYLYSICRILWVKELGKRQLEKQNIKDNHEYKEEIYDDLFEQLIQKNEQYKLFQEHFARLGNDCQKILQMYFQKIPLQTIADMMGFKSDKYAKKRKFRCKEYLIKSIKQDLQYQKIINGDL